MCFYFKIFMSHLPIMFKVAHELSSHMFNSHIKPNGTKTFPLAGSCPITNQTGQDVCQFEKASEFVYMFISCPFFQGVQGGVYSSPPANSVFITTVREDLYMKRIRLEWKQVMLRRQNRLHSFRLQVEDHILECSPNFQYSLQRKNSAASNKKW